MWGARHRHGHCRRPHHHAPSTLSDAGGAAAAGVCSRWSTGYPLSPSLFLLRRAHGPWPTVDRTAAAVPSCIACLRLVLVARPVGPGGCECRCPSCLFISSGMRGHRYHRPVRVGRFAVQPHWERWERCKQPGLLYLPPPPSPLRPVLVARSLSCSCLSWWPAGGCGRARCPCSPGPGLGGPQVGCQLACLLQTCGATSMCTWTQPRTCTNPGVHPLHFHAPQLLVLPHPGRGPLRALVFLAAPSGGPVQQRVAPCHHPAWHPSMGCAAPPPPLHCPRCKPSVQ